MKIFLSYAGEDRATAEKVVHSIRTHHHQIFFDRDDLPVGESYDDRITNAIREADLFIFLVSPDSVSSGKFTLTELKSAQKKWLSPARPVLPVMVRKTSYDDIPIYLKAVTVLGSKLNG